MAHATTQHRCRATTVALASTALGLIAAAVGCTEHMAADVPPAHLFAANSVDVPNDHAAVPFVMHDGVPVVTVRYAAPRVTAAVATGSPAGEFTVSTGKLLAMSPPDAAWPTNVPPPDGSIHAMAGLMHAAALTVHGVTFRDFDVAADFDGPPEVSTSSNPTAPWPSHGRLGGMMFRNVLLTVDYPNALLWVDHGQLPPVDGDEVLPLVMSEHGYPLVDVHVGPTHYWAKLDTGSAAALRVPAALRQQFAGAVQLQAGRNVLSCPTPEIGPDQLVTIGSGALHDFAVTFDMAHGRVRLHRRIDATPATASAAVVARAHG